MGACAFINRSITVLSNDVQQSCKTVGSVRWVRLRERYAREKRREFIENSSGETPVKKKEWYLLKDMEFLSPHVKRRKASQLTESECRDHPVLVEIEIERLDHGLPWVKLYHSRWCFFIVPTNTSDNIEESNSANELEDSQPPAPSLPAPSLPPPSLPPPSPSSSTSEEYKKKNVAPRKKRFKKKYDTLEQSLCSLSELVGQYMKNNMDKGKDEDEHFGKLVACELNKIPESEKKKKKADILKILYNS
ncbi:unnamed protein product [Timema podura]|uniref:MADF domain-containing protein n=1 Tax=Timema podura TaxID=61482 RepID=A0ABN7NXH9_TIMPD|nr:unnamed protein product [Timema podura]